MMVEERRRLERKTNRLVDRRMGKQEGRTKEGKEMMRGGIRENGNE